MNLKIANVDVVVDEFVVEFVLKHIWKLKPTHLGMVPHTDIGYVGLPEFVPMQNLLLGLGPETKVIHRNGSFIDHRLVNLRVVQP